MNEIRYLSFTMNRICLTLLVVATAACSGKQSNPEKVIVNDDFKWTIKIPAGFDFVDAQEQSRVQNKGLDAVEDATGMEVDNQAKTIFMYRSDETNNIEANYQPFDEAIDGDFIESNKMVEDIVYETFVSQMPGAEVDTTRSVAIIDGLDFQKFSTKIVYPNKMVMHLDMYSRLFDKRQLTINIIYTDEEKGEALNHAWERSKFAK